MQVLVSGAIVKPSGHRQEYDPGSFIQVWLHSPISKHSSISENKLYLIRSYVLLDIYFE